MFNKMIGLCFIAALPLASQAARPAPKKAIAPVASKADIWKVGNGEMKFFASAKPGFLKINGTSPKKVTGQLELKDQALQGDLNLDLTKLDSGIELRDEHMRDKYLEVGKYPIATLKLHPIKSWLMDKGHDGSFTGEMTLHNETKPIEGKYEYDPKTKQVTASFGLKVSQYKIDVPTHLGVTVGDEVKIDVTMNLEK